MWEAFTDDEVEGTSKDDPMHISDDESSSSLSDVDEEGGEGAGPEVCFKA